jgi:tRNA pseudouridine13 synthase
VSSEAITDRQQRTTVHQALRRIFHSRLESSTAKDGSLIISMAARGNKNARNGNAAGRLRGKLGWDERGGEYLYFTLHKENKDTMEIVAFLGSQLKIGAKNFQFAGTKDRRAVTVQRMSAYRLEATALARVGKNLRNAVVGDYEYRQSGLELGQSSGNEFAITLRDCHFPGEDGMDQAQRLELATTVVAQSIDSFGRNGFINYFGLQRFGSFETPTSTIGMRLLHGDFKGAADYLLAYPPAALEAAQKPEGSEDASGPLVSRDDKSRALAIHTFFNDPKSQKALSLMPRKFSAESSLIRHLNFVDRKSGTLSRANDFQGAFGQIPRNLRNMYLHAYQSLVWNTAAGKRWELFGDRVVEGDLVVVSEHRDKEAQPAVAEEEAEVDESGEVVIVPEGAASGDDPFTRARALTAEEVASGKYTIRDVVLPLPGWDVIYPANAIGEAYKEFMASEAGGGLDPYNMRRKHKDYSLAGDYRKLIAGTDKGMGFDVKEYASETEQLVKTDLEKLQEASEQDGEGTKDTNMTDAAAAGEESKEASETEKKIAVVLRFQLGSSQYATMALRELMKQGGLQEYTPTFGGR